MTLRILHIIYDDIGNPWVGGGGAFRTLEIYSRMAAQGHRVQVVCGRYPDAPTRETRKGVYYRRVGYPKQYLLSRLTYVVEAARLIKQGGYDIVIEDVSPFSPVGCPLWKPGLVPATASVQNLYGGHTTRKYGMLGWGPRLVEKPLLGLFTNFVVSSEDAARRLRERLGSRANICIVGYSAGELFFQAGEQEQSGRRNYILSIGRIDVYQKGLDRLVSSFDKVAERLPGVELLIAGGGAESQMANLQRMLKESKYSKRIKLLGPVGQQEAARLMRDALFVAIPSRYETGPITALEAAAAGTAVVGTRIEGLRSNAPQYPRAHGMLVNEDDNPALVGAMLKVAQDEELRRDMGRRGREWVKQFTWDALAEAQLQFYEEIVSRRRRVK